MDPAWPNVGSPRIGPGPAGAVLLALVVAALVAVPLLRAGETAGALSKPEAGLQGTWKSKSGWQLVFKDRTFSASGDNEWYRGSFSAPATDLDPAPMDIKIESCGTSGGAGSEGLFGAPTMGEDVGFGDSGCKHKGLVSKSIYRRNGEGLLLSGGIPGEARPLVLEDQKTMRLDMTRVAAAKLP